MNNMDDKSKFKNSGEKLPPWGSKENRTREKYIQGFNVIVIIFFL